MVLNRSHIPWLLFVLAVTALGAALYVANVHPGVFLPYKVRLPAFFGPSPPVRNTVGGTPLGLAFGIVSFLLFVFAAALGIRKKQRTWPLGNVQWWLKAHIWLTSLTLPFVCFHCDFKSGGPMTTTLVILFIVVMGSGYLGLAFQQFMPRMITHRLPREMVYEQIPFVREQLIQKAETLWKELAPASRQHSSAFATVPAASGAPSSLEEDTSAQIIGEFLHDECFPYLRARRGDRHRLATAKAAEDTFRLLRMHVSERWREKVDLMYQWCEDRRLLDVQTSLHHWLHGWLLIHVPLSFALLVLTLWHGYVTLLYL